MSENRSFKEGIKEILEENNFLPISETDWKCLTVIHTEPSEDSEKRRTNSKIRSSLGDKRKKGVYVYKKEKTGEILYVGRGNLYGRITQHYRESYVRVPETHRYKKWYEFFSSHKGKLNVFWKEMEAEKGEVIESMLSYVMEPAFVSFKSNRRLRGQNKP